MSDPTEIQSNPAEINVFCGNTVFPCLALEGGFALVLFSEKALSVEIDGIHVGDVIEIDKGHAIRTVSRKHPCQSRFLLAWDDENPAPIERVAEAINHFGGKCIGYLPEKRVLVVLHDKPLSFPSPPGVLIVASYPHTDQLKPPITPQYR